MKSRICFLSLTAAALILFTGCPAPDNYFLDENIVHCYLNQSHQLELNNNFLFTNVVITSSDEDILIVNNVGLITPKASGRAFIDIEHGSIHKELEVIVFNEYWVAGAIRNSTGMWYLCNNDKHESVGIEAINTDTEKITLMFNFNASKVETFSVTPDETMASGGYFVGTSVGLSEAYIYVYKYDGTNVVAVNPQTVCAKLLNLWIDGKLLP